MAQPASPFSAEPIPRRYWWLKRLSLAGVILASGLIGLRWWWGVYADRELQAEVQSIQARGEPIFPEDFDPSPIPDEQNAAILLKQAAKAISLTIDQERLVSDFYSLVPIQDDQWENARAIIEKNERVFDLVRRARDLPGVDWGFRYRSPVVPGMTPDLSGQRTLAKLLLLRARYEHEEGRESGCVEALRDVLALSTALESMPARISHLVAIGNASLATYAVEDLVPSMQV